MTTLIKSKFESFDGTLIIPIYKNGTSSETIAKIALEFGLNPDRLTLDLKCEAKEMTSFYAQKADKTLKIYLLGLGEKPTSADIITIFRSLSFQQKMKIGDQVAISFLHSNRDDLGIIEAATNGFFLGVYRIGFYKSEKNGLHPFLKEEANLTIFSGQNEEETQKAAQKGLFMAETQRRVMDLVNAAPNVKTPQYLGEWAVESGEKNGFSTTIFDQKMCEDTGLHALLSVNKGSPLEPRFIIMDYAPENARAVVGLVGKGITFDTGGISIKPSSNMYLMKSDMGGAGAVLGAVEMAAKLKLPVRVVGIVPSTENMVDGKGTKPGDVINSYLGKTIEVIDTDAEGRLILADGLAYMKKNFNPDYLIDLATLTGNIIMALGNNAAGLFSNNDDLAAKLAAASEQSGERLWRLPIWEAYLEDMKSDVADIANLGNKPMAGSITAAKFLEQFIDGHTAWAHLDIAGMAMTNNELGQHRLATAYGVRLLTTFLASL